MKLTKVHKQKIKKLRTEYSEFTKEFEKKYSKLADEIGIDESNDYLFDYIFNGFGTFELIEQNGQVKMQ